MKSMDEWIESGIIYQDGDGNYIMHVWLDFDTEDEVHYELNLGRDIAFARVIANSVNET